MKYQLILKIEFFQIRRKNDEKLSKFFIIKIEKSRPTSTSKISLNFFVFILRFNVNEIIYLEKAAYSEILDPNLLLEYFFLVDLQISTF